MIAVIFEVGRSPSAGRTTWTSPRAGRDLETIDGFISIERFESLTSRASCCRSRSGATRRRCAWRNLKASRGADKGRGGIFADYRLRVADVIRDYGMNDRAGAQDDSRTIDD